MIAFMFVFSFRVEFIDFFVLFIEDGGARANLMKESLSVFPAEYYDIYLFSKSGFADDILALNDPFVHLISVEDMAK